jgi:hypothetical protein
MKPASQQASNPVRSANNVILMYTLHIYTELVGFVEWNKYAFFLRIIRLFIARKEEYWKTWRQRDENLWSSKSTIRRPLTGRRKMATENLIKNVNDTNGQEEYMDH